MTQGTAPSAGSLTAPDLEDRIRGSLATAMIGDALGAPTEQRSIPEIRQMFGGRVEAFFPPPPDAPYAKGRRAAQITDDSSQMLMLCEVLIRGEGDIRAIDVAEMLVTWSQNTEYFPHFAGPSTRAAIERLKGGADPETVGAQGHIATEGASNGGAMRVAPVGLVHPGDPRGAVQAAAVTCRPSHFTSLGVAGAAAIAGAVAAALTPDATVLDVVRAAMWSAEQGEEIGATQGRRVAGPSVSRRIELAVKIASASRSLDQAVQEIADVVGAGLSAAEAVPAAIGIFVAASGDPWATVVGGANIGDDTDTIACMAGAVAGALRGFSAVPLGLYQDVVAANGVDLDTVAHRLAGVAWRT